MLIGIAGRKGSGKSTLARGLATSLSVPTRVFSFADGIKRVAQDFWGCEPWQVYGTDAEKQSLVPECQSLTVRQLLQRIAEVMKDIDPNVHTRRLLKQYLAFYGSRLTDKPGYAPVGLIDDMRFPEEAAAVKACGGHVIRLNRGQDGDPHRSEKGWSAITPDLDIPTNTDAEETLSVVLHWVQQHRWEYPREHLDRVAGVISSMTDWKAGLR